jgi:hypothetical protein
MCDAGRRSLALTHQYASEPVCHQSEPVGCDAGEQVDVLVKAFKHDPQRQQEEMPNIQHNSPDRDDTDDVWRGFICPVRMSVRALRRCDSSRDPHLVLMRS